MPETINITATGGMAVVILGRDFDIPSDYAYHPQVHPIMATDLPMDAEEINDKLPSTTKIVLIGGELASPKFGALRTALTRRRLTFVQRRNRPALEDALRACLPLKNGATKEPQPTNGQPATAPAKTQKGSVSELVRTEANLSKGSAEEARRLMRIAQERGIPTTVASLAQAISNAKRKGGRTETPRSIMSAQQSALKTLDEAIAGLQLIRDYVAETETLNIDLNKKLDAFKALLK